METRCYNVFLKGIAASLGMDEHCSSHCQRQTYDFWMRHTKSRWEIDNNIMEDSDYIDILCDDFGHSSVRITEKHYNKKNQKIIKHRQLELNLGKEAVDLVTESYFSKI